MATFEKPTCARLGAELHTGAHALSATYRHRGEHLDPQLRMTPGTVVVVPGVEPMYQNEERGTTPATESEADRRPLRITRHHTNVPCATWLHHYGIHYIYEEVYGEASGRA